MFQLKLAAAFTKMAENLQILRKILNFEPKSFLERSQQDRGSHGGRYSATR
jgi:hypothetical protein